MVKIYLAQMQPILCEKDKNIEKIIGFIKEASIQKADLILFPELALTGYFTRNRTEEMAETLEGPSINKIRMAAEEYRIKVILGYPERHDRKIYNSACFINHDGSIIGNYQKVHLWDEETKYFSPGNGFNVWETDIGRIGIMICYDTEFPETARTLALKGAQMILAPTANMLPYDKRQTIQIQSRAVDNQVFVATTNQVGVEEDTCFFGGSAAANPFGELLALCGQSESGIIVNLNLDEIGQSRNAQCYLKDRQPELYKDLCK
ncbi:carbon-nitrogen hydrolase family protein [Scopulibacillus cellulosilyticus]|uniref:Carbon-nitrogen hydrolase family protein n=1 Tax=Scopulibacillus cellulosilyticus TaxID=2665665 RepID=A0ABW2PWV4_9BACL